ncbi:hypothetical protein [Alicyclobacillus dauci]|uniref:Uncharacterized protein n=1 Tax=Alicyclobacillus dauci TaxID=1475485 RepID=A0ABY6ZAK4_9BACL|nr:hypothetical protein [Alicyclobacillus dauci]WAH39487.1 hypothetical protein NZD86_24270 [Alicyclobacillus dauci]WAH39547.1 hypothetical protein NZD86_23970 [Alicyclobacillus dauci]
MWDNGELVFVVVGEAETYLCALDWLSNWIASGYRVYGAADTVSDIERMYRDAWQEEGMK